jgi:hypothetical protein
VQAQRARYQRKEPMSLHTVNAAAYLDAAQVWGAPGCCSTLLPSMRGLLAAWR